MSQTATNSALIDDGTAITTFDGDTQTPVFAELHTIRDTGDISVTHDTVILPSGTVIPRIQGASLAGFLTRIEDSEVVNS